MGQVKEVQGFVHFHISRKAYNNPYLPFISFYSEKPYVGLTGLEVEYVHVHQ